MPSPTEITVSQLARLIGTPHGGLLIDVRGDDDVAPDPRLIPGSVQRNADDVASWLPSLGDRPAIVIGAGQDSQSEGIAALLRHGGRKAETLEGGFKAWVAAGQPLVRTGKLPARDRAGRTVWVTRARPKIDRIACPWLLRRFVDPDAVILFVPQSEVQNVAERFNAAPFDIEGVFWSHRGEKCSFDAMIEEFGLDLPPLHRLAAIVRGADTSRLDIAPEASGLLAVSLGFSRMYRDDIEQLNAAMPIYDALYRWARDASDETHNWPNPGVGRS